MGYESEGETGPPTRREAVVVDVDNVLSREDLPIWNARLAEVITEQIVPRLEKLHLPIRGGAAIEPPTREEIREFARLTMAMDGDAALAYFQKMRAKRHSLETLFEHFLAPTARYLGELWEQDLCDFVDVTLGVARLQELLATFSLAHDIPISDIRRRVMLFTIPGENHVFGVDMVGKFMAGAGWETTIHRGLRNDECADAVSEEWIGVIGATLSSENGLETLARTIETARRHSTNPSLSVVVGGNLFNERPELVAQVGADAAASDAPTAVILSKKLLLMQFAPSYDVSV